MANEIEKLYERYKKWGNISVDHDMILAFYPDYYKLKTELEQLTFISKEEAEEYFESHYKDSRLYKILTDLAMAEDEIYNLMKQNMELKYHHFSLLFRKAIDSIIQLCELIDYIGHYPATWPVPKEEEKNQEMEELLERYDIMIRYYLDDEPNKMQITSNDVVRVIDTLKIRLELFKSIREIVQNNNWLVSEDRASQKYIEL